MNSRFITFEGCEGSGKSTQAKLLESYFSKHNIFSLLTREPGGTALAEKLRSVLLSGDKITDPLTEFLILSAARRDHVENKIKPALKNNINVICDRFIDSSLAYQGYGKGLSLKKMEDIFDITIDDFTPDITFLIDIDPARALERIFKNRANEQNHYDKMDLAFHSKIRYGFLELANRNQSRIHVLDGSKEPEIIHEEILRILSSST